MKLPHAYTRRLAVVRLSDTAFRLHLSVMSLLEEQGTETVARFDLVAVPHAPTGRRLDAVLNELELSRLWVANGEGWAVEIPREAANGRPGVSPELSAKRAAAGRKGGLAKKSIDQPDELKDRARTLMSRAIDRGELVREPCAVCGEARTHGHHHDYTKPLDVTWLCERHHEEEHTRLRKELLAQQASKSGEQKPSNLLEAKVSNLLNPAGANGPDLPSSLELSPLNQASQALVLSGFSPDSSALSSSDQGPDRLPARAANSRRSKPRTEAPDTLEPTPRHQQIAAERGIDLAVETERCLAHHRGKGNLQANWNAVLTTWLLSPYAKAGTQQPASKVPGQNFNRLNARIARMELEEAEREAH